MYRISDANSKPQGTEDEFVVSGTANRAVTDTYRLLKICSFSKYINKIFSFSGFFCLASVKTQNQQKKYYPPSVGTGINPLRGFIPVIYSHNGNNIREDAI